MAGFEVLTFDCYGTLVDWDAGISGALIEAARSDGITLARESILDAYHEIEPRLESGIWRPYKDVLAEAAVEVATRLGWSLARDRADFLAASLARWTPFPDTIPALESLAARGIALGILSNVDDDLLAGTLGRLAVPFEFTVTAGQVRSYKPAPAHFRRGRELAGDRRWLHVAQSLFHDVDPARSLGISVAWINRRGEDRGGHAKPDFEAATLGDLVENVFLSGTGGG